MAALQKIRSHGPLLVIVIGLALFAFIAGDAWKAIQPHTQPNAGEVNGDKLTINEYQEMVNEYTEAAKLLQGMGNLTEEQSNYFRDIAWNDFVSNKLIEEQAEELGLVVTNQEMMAVYSEGTNPMLRQTPFLNPKTGLFDKDQMTMFLTQYTSMDKRSVPQQYHDIYSVWMFIEKQLKAQLLRQKYEALLGQSLLSNPVEAKTAFDQKVNQTNALIAAVPYSSVIDSDAKVSDSEIKEAYDKKKEQFKQYVETRKVKYIDLPIVASEEDKAEIEKEVKLAEKELKEATKDFASKVRAAESVITYPLVMISQNNLPTDVASRLEKTKVGETVETYYNALDNTYNTFKVVAKEQLPDTVRFQQLVIQADSPEKRTQLTDSVVNALNKGAKFDEMAKKFAQPATEQTINSAQYERSQIDTDNAKFINALMNTAKGKYHVINFPQANLVYKVIDRKKMVDKYEIAIVKRPVNFSKETYNEIYNNFSQFVAENNSLEKFEKNAEEAGYKLLEVQALPAAAHNIGGVAGTHEALKWAYEAEPNEVSVIYDCQNGTHLMAVALESVAPEGYVPFEQIKERLRSEVMMEKKANMIMKDVKAKDFKNIADFGGFPSAVIDTVKHISFEAPAFIPAVSASEPMVSAVAYATNDKVVSKPFKGNAAVFVLQPIAKEKLNDEYNQTAIEQGLTGLRMRMLSGYMQDLFKMAEIEDNRYLFFQ